MSEGRIDRSPGRMLRPVAAALTACLLASLACSFPTRPEAPAETPAEEMPMVEAGGTPTAPPALAETATPAPPATATITPSPTLGPPVFTAAVNANCRTGPGLVYGVVRVLSAGSTSSIVGRNAASTWWVVTDGPQCWVSGSTGAPSGDLSGVPVIADPPTPTPTHTATPTATPTVGLIILPPRTLIVLPPLVAGSNVTADRTSYRGACPYRATWSGTITTTGPLTVEYIWQNSHNSGPWSDSTWGGTLVFASGGTQPVLDFWTETPIDVTLAARVRVTSPGSLYSNGVTVTIDCTP